MHERVVLFEKLTGYRFRKPYLLLEAVTHSSYANENGCVCNERLEFLGDSVLGVIVSDYLFSRKPAISEGEMTRVRAASVCEKALAHRARQLRLGELLRLGHGEARSGGADRDSVLADATEAVIAALYLDGGFSVARSFVLSFLEDTIEDAVRGGAVRDYKTELQEKYQAKNAAALEYAVIAESGPDHDKRFTVTVSLGGKTLGTGIGKSKKAAELDAARMALEDPS